MAGGAGEAGDDILLGLVRLESGSEIALRHLHIANPLIADAKVDLPSGISWIGFGEAVCDGEAVLEGF